MSQDSSDYEHIPEHVAVAAPLDNNLNPPMDIDCWSPVNAKVLSHLGSKWTTTLLSPSNPDLMYPDMIASFTKLMGPVKPISMDGSTKNWQTCISLIKDNISDDLSLLTGSTSECEWFEFIIELANTLTFDLTAVPFSIMSDKEYRRSLDFMAEYRNSIKNLHMEITKMRQINEELCKEIETLKSQPHTIQATTQTKQVKNHKNITAKTAMTTEQHAKMIANIIKKHPNTSIQEAYQYSTMISEYIPWSPPQKPQKNGPPPPIPYNMRPSFNTQLLPSATIQNNPGPKTLLKYRDIFTHLKICHMLFLVWNCRYS
ncbi:hypothetical protein AX17_007221 [Amanita inopinata Kibby_2008]|nr:hypothetical protein AX17_007221 [Amanita inopinata Kibby_2008]